ncbi:STAS domain-containing protein [Streptomyces niveus]|uniref:STAS domain-containing protein n=1 Tax=Streptomyces niveus TaxID=193462 RepID=UPI00365A67E6
MRAVMDPGNELLVEQELRRLLPCCGPRTVVVDMYASLVTSSTLRVLLRVRRQAREQGVTLMVVARHPLAREVFRAQGLSRALHVRATLPGTDTSLLPCHAAQAPARPWRKRLSALRDRPAGKPSAPFSDACRSPHLPEGKS